MINKGFIFLLKLTNVNNEICIRIGSKKDIDKKFFSEFKNSNGYYSDKKNKTRWKHIDILKLTYINDYEQIEQNIINKLSSEYRLYFTNYHKTFLLQNNSTYKISPQSQISKIMEIYVSEINNVSSKYNKYEYINFEEKYNDIIEELYDNIIYDDMEYENKSISDELTYLNIKKILKENKYEHINDIKENTDNIIVSKYSNDNKKNNITNHMKNKVDTNISSHNDNMGENKIMSTISSHPYNDQIIIHKNYHIYTVDISSSSIVYPIIISLFTSLAIKLFK